VGRITKAAVKGLWMRFEGELFMDVDEPERFRFSYEINSAHIASFAAKHVWRIRKFDRFSAMALVREPVMPAHRSSRMRVRTS
jgi:hypothetical protein